MPVSDPNSFVHMETKGIVSEGQGMRSNILTSDRQHPLLYIASRYWLGKDVTGPRTIIDLFLIFWKARISGAYSHFSIGNHLSTSAHPLPDEPHGSQNTNACVGYSPSRPLLCNVCKTGKKKKKQGSYCTKEESHVKRAHVTVLLVNPGFALAQRSLTARTKKTGS